MLNYIWLGLVLAAVIIGGYNDRLKEVAAQSFDSANFAVMNTALPLVGVIALWLGIMRLAERGGLVALLARVLRPLLRWLFPDVPAEHPAMGSMLMNMAANMLGLGNAATPLGLRAMKHLESLNPHPGTATNAMCTFLAINTSSIQLIPVTAIAILAANHSKNASAIVGTSIMATTCAAICGIGMAKILGKMQLFRVPAELLASLRTSPSETSAAADEKLPIKESTTIQPLTFWGIGALIAYGLFFAYLFIRLSFPEVYHLKPSETLLHQSNFVRAVNAFSIISVPLLLSAFPLYAALRRVKVYEEFVEGAKEGFDVAIRIIPYLVAILVAIGMFRAAGGIDIISKLLGPLMSAIGFPSDLLPLVLMRPLSGSGSLGMFTDIVKNLGPDSLIARTAGTIYGSTETTFYVLAVYFGAVGIKRTRYALLAGLVADLVGVIASVIVCRLVFG